jgi:hypothetical protein
MRQDFDDQVNVEVVENIGGLSLRRHGIQEEGRKIKRRFQGAA